MKFYQLLALLIPAYLLTACGSDLLEDFTKETSFPGVEGQILHLNKGCGNPLHDEEQYPDEYAMVAAYSGGNELERVNTDEQGQFSIELASGTYNIKVFPSESFIDEGIKDISIDLSGGIRIRRSYKNLFWPWVLIVVFPGDTTRQRISEILNENELTEISSNNVGTAYIYEVGVPNSIHVQEMMEVLENGYAEVDGVELSFFTCAD